MSGPLGLPFSTVLLLDTEFVGRDETGDNPVPVCAVVRDLGTGQVWREMADGHGRLPPWPTGPDVLVVAFSAASEWRYFLEVGWPLPERIIDLYYEAIAETNGISGHSPSLLTVLSRHNIPAITKDEKSAGRQLAMRGFPYTAAEREELLIYCQSDVDVLAPLLERMLTLIRATPQGLHQALIRGRYSCAVARMESTGIPIDVPMHDELTDRWPDVQVALIGAVTERWPVYDGTSFNPGAFRTELLRRGIIDWPETKTGQLKLDQDLLRDQAKSRPELYELYEVRHALGGMRMNDLHVGADGRNRAWLAPFWTRTGRNQPSSSQFLFALPAWMRFLCLAQPGHVIVGLDYKAQEIGIAATRSNDDVLLADLMTGDPYMAFATRAGLAPRGATKRTHPEIRARCKTTLLGANYGMQARELARRLGIMIIESSEMLLRLRMTYPRYTAWAQSQIDTAYLRGITQSVFGWPMIVPGLTKPTTLLNYPMQSDGSEMLRLACSKATEAGLSIVAPVHDALVLETPEDTLEQSIDTARTAMVEASREVLGGFELSVDTGDHVHPDYPRRFYDERGEAMWNRVLNVLASLRVAA